VHLVVVSLQPKNVVNYVHNQDFIIMELLAINALKMFIHVH